MCAPVVRWTPAEWRWFGALASAGLRADTGMLPAMRANDDATWLEVLLDRPATLWLEPTDWRDAWVLVFDEGELAPGDRLVVTRRELRADLRVRKRGLVRGGDVIAAITDVAFERYTRQSTALPAGRGWAAPTEPERAPWWELDTGAARYVSSLAIQIAAPPHGTRVTVRAYGFALPDGTPPPHTTIFEGIVGDDAVELEDDIVAIEVTPGAVARLVRVELGAAEPVSLAVLATEVLAVELHVDSLATTMRRAFALWSTRLLADGRTYAQVWARAMEVADALAARLERDGARVVLGVMLPSSLDWIAVDQAALARGYVVVALAHDEPDDRLAHVVATARPACIVCEPGNLARVRALGVDAVTCAELAGAPPAPPAAPRDPGDTYAVLFTSGSTGTPRGAIRTYAQFHTVIASYAIGHSPRHVSFQPISHLSERMYLPALLVHGGEICFSRGGAHVLDDLAAFEPTTIGSVPRLFEVLYARYRRRVDVVGEPAALAEARRAFGSNLLALSVGSAPCSPEVLAFLRRCFADVWVFEGYGSTELGTIAVDGRESDQVAVKLVAVDGGHEIHVRTPHLFGGYLGEAAPATDADGFFATGDLGERDADGHVRVVGRVRNTVKLANGEFVSAERIETALATAPGVDRVYVHAVPGAHGVAAVVVPSDRELDVDALRAHGRRAGLPDYALPRGVIVEPEAPSVDNGLLLPSGKLARPAFASRFGAALDALVTGGAVDASPPSGDSIVDEVTRTAASVIGRAVDPDAPLGPGLGADSLAVAEILAAISDRLGRDVPLAWWFEAATLGDLARRIAGVAGRADEPVDVRADRDLAVATLPPPRNAPETVLVTGATGFLGAHLVEAFAARGVLTVALVRAPDDRAAAARMAAAFARWRIPPCAVHAIAGDLEHPRGALAGVDAVVHCAAQVSWLASYATLRRPNVLGTHALLDAAATARVPAHFVSTISTTAGDEDATLPFETMLAATPYALSKWIAEQHARAAGATIYRPAMIAGHTTRGAGNLDDFVHRYLAGCLELGVAIDHATAVFDTTPVDYVAAAIAALVHAGAQGTFHLANADRSLTYREVAAALGVRAVPYRTFRAAIGSSPRLRPLHAFFPPRSPPAPSAVRPRRSDARLAELGVERPRIDAAIAARYVAFARNSIK